MKIILALIVIVPIILYRGWVLFTMWNWFIVPLGAPHISLFHVLGISVIINVLTNHSEIKKKSTKETLTELCTFIGMLTAALCIGWIIKSFI